jgi:ABC-type nickel/cobalt efflux system permease component RcnA
VNPVRRILSNPAFREKQSIHTNRSVPPLRLMSTIIVALLAITMAILPISVPQAAMPAGHGYAMAVDGGHGHAAAVEGDHEHADAPAASADLDNHDGDSQDCGGAMCCSMSTCHAFQESAAPSVFSPAVSRISMAAAGDDQVGGITTGGLDRPPRTV